MADVGECRPQFGKTPGADAWFVGVQVTFFLFLVGPLLILRAVLGVDSPYVP